MKRPLAEDTTEKPPPKRWKPPTFSPAIFNPTLETDPEWQQTRKSIQEGPKAPPILSVKLPIERH